MKECWLTTEDNPYDFFKDFGRWYAFDEQKGYHTCQYLARVIDLPLDAPYDEYLEVLNKVVNDAVRLNLNGNYKKVYREDDENDENKS